ncbi:phage tail-collar fiber domain-containing protein [Providencia rettgeri]
MASVITIAFENWKAQEAASGKAVLLDEFVFANVPNLDPTQPIDRNEKLPPANQIVHRQAVNKAGLASENAVAYSVTLGADVGNFDFNWIGLLNKASGTVAMITHAPTQKKLKTQNGQQGNVLTRSFILEFQGAAEETQIKTSAETWQIDFTARLSGIDEMQRLINVDSYGAAAFFNDGFEVTRSGEQFTVKKGLGYVGGLRGELAQNQILNGLRNTKVYVDFSYQGNIVSQWNTVVKITSAATLNNYIDAAGFAHQVFAIASIDASGNITDLRPKGALIDQSLSALEKQLKLDLSKKFDKANISGVLGNDNDKAPSLHLLTVELGKLQPKGSYAPSGYSYSKDESDGKYQPKGNYAPAGDYATNTALASGLALKFNSTGGYLSGSINVNGTTEALSVRLSSSGSTRKINLFPPQADSEEAYFQYVDGQSWSGRVKIPITSGVSMLYSTGNTTTDSSGFVRTGSKTALITENVVQSVGTSTSNVMSQKAVTDALLGINQNWVDVKSQRSANTDYTNSTGKPIFVSISSPGSGGAAGGLIVNGITVGVISSASAAMSIGAVIPAGANYKYTSTNIGAWVELR